LASLRPYDFLEIIFPQTSISTQLFHNPTTPHYHVPIQILTYLRPVILLDEQILLLHPHFENNFEADQLDLSSVLSRCLPLLPFGSSHLPPSSLHVISENFTKYKPNASLVSRVEINSS
jgi:hypothetical protein